MNEPKMYRQGDVLIIESDRKVKAGAKRQALEGGRAILAHGEVTGHAHAIDGKTASLYLDDSTRIAPDVMPTLALAGGLRGDRLLIAKADTEVRHEEHGRIPLAKGARFTVRQQRQYQWGRSQRVAD